MLCYIYCSVMFNFVVFCSVLLHLATPACWIILVMPTRRSPGHAQLSRVLCYFHPLQCSHGTITLFSNHGGGGSAPPTPPPGSFPTSIASTLALESQIVLFFSKSRQSCTHSSTLRWAQTL